MRSSRPPGVAGVLAALALGMSCSEGTMSRASQTPADQTAPSGNKSWSEQDFRWVDPAEAARFHELRAALDAALVGWNYLGFQRGGAFQRWRWCGSSTDPKACADGSLRNLLRWDSEWVVLSTHGFGNRLPEVFGLGLEIGALSGDWGLFFNLSLGGRDMTGDHLTIQFVRWETNQGRALLSVGDRDSYQVVDKVFTAPLVAAGEDAAAANLALIRELRASPESFRGAVLRRLDALEAEVRRGISAHEAYRCRYAEVPAGTSVPPPCEPVPLPPDEEQAQLGLVEAIFDGRRALLDAELNTLYTLFTARVPERLVQP